MKQVGIIGNGGQAQELIGYLNEEGVGHLYTALDVEYMSDPSTQVDIKNPTEEEREHEVIVAIGAPGLKRDMVQQWPGTLYGTVISSRAYVASTAHISGGSTIAPLASIGPNATIGAHNLANISASVAHDCRVGDYVSISPGVHIGGNVTIGDGCFIGIGATIKNNVTIAPGSVIGAGAVIVKDIEEENSVVVGIPGKVINHNKDWLYAI